MWARLSPRTMNRKVSVMEISMELETNLKTSEAPLVCKLSDSPFRILRVGYGSFVQLFSYIGRYDFSAKR